MLAQAAMGVVLEGRGRSNYKLIRNRELLHLQHAPQTRVQKAAMLFRSFGLPEALPLRRGQLYPTRCRPVCSLALGQKSDPIQECIALAKAPDRVGAEILLHKHVLGVSF